MALKEIWSALKAVIDNETKSYMGEFMLEVCSLNSCGQPLDLTSAIVGNSNDLLLNNADSDSTTANEFSFSKFLSQDFLKQPFVLVSRERRSSVVEDSQKLSTPTSIKSNGISPLKTLNNRFNSQESNVSDVWGSPLKCNIPAEDDSVGLVSLDSSQASVMTKKQRPKRLGIPLNWARKIVSAFNVNACGTSNPPSVLILCDGGDKRNTAISGVKIVPIPQTAEQPAKVLKVVTLTVNEKGNIDDWNTELKMDGQLPQACQAVYQVNTGPMDREEPWGTVAVEVKWKGASRLLEIPPTEASTTIKASVKSGSMQSSMSTYHQELQFLGRIITALTTGQVEWMSTGSESEKPILPLTASVEGLIKTLQEEGSLGSVAAQSEAEAWTFATALKSFSIAERKDYDFTDRLWKDARAVYAPHQLAHMHSKVMVQCMSMADLVSSLRLVFTALGHGQLKPFVDRHNHTTVAQMVREAFTGRFSAPSLTGIQPFLFLAEMGAEKLRRDYIHIFASQCLATPSALESFTATERELHAKLEDLSKMHAVLEMVALHGASLRLPTDTLGSIARQMLSHYRQHPVNPQHVFSFSVKTSQVRYILATLRPVMWCSETTNQVASTDNVYESSLSCLCATQPFFHLQSRSKGLCVSKRDNSENQGNEVELSTLGDAKGEYCLVQRKESVMIM